MPRTRSSFLPQRCSSALENNTCLPRLMDEPGCSWSTSDSVTRRPSRSPAGSRPATRSSCRGPSRCRTANRSLPPVRRRLRRYRLSRGAEAETTGMNITQFSIRNPLVVGALTVALALFGIYSYLTLGVAVVPSISIPAVIVTTTEPGANPDTIETQITKPIEDAISTLRDIDTLSSTSTQGVSTVTVQFTTAANADLVGVDVERVVTGARGKLPAAANAPTVIKADTSAFPVLTFAVSGPQPLDQIDDVAENQVKRAIEAVPGVSSVSVVGAPTREIWVKADLAKLQARGLGLTSLQQALQSAQLEQPAGTLVSNSKDATVVLNGLVGDPRQLGDIVVSQTTGGPVYVRDVATIDDTLATPSSIARVDGVSAITLTASKLPNASNITVSRDVQSALAALAPSLPQDMQMRVVT